MGNYKKICWTDADVQCPFYISDDRSGRSITCEGYSAGAEVVSRFRTLGQKDRHMGCFCVGRFTRCPIFRCTYSNKYGDDQ